MKAMIELDTEIAGPQGGCLCAVAVDKWIVSGLPFSTTAAIHFHHFSPVFLITLFLECCSFLT